MNQKFEKMKKFAKVFDGFRASTTQPKGLDIEIDETLRSDHFQVSKTVRHGFPFQPTAMAYDPVQNLLAIGTKTGSLRIFGTPGVDCLLKHDCEVVVIQILFLVNEGALVTVCSDNNLHLWNLRQKQPTIVHSLKFKRDRITHCHLPFQSKWLYVGTEGANVYIVNIESFTLSGYIISWNKAMALARKKRLGPVVHLSDNPLDPNKLLIGFQSGTVVLWDLKNKSAECRYNESETLQALRSIAWNHDGKQFLCSHQDGSLTIWNCRNPAKPQSILLPHGKIGKDGKPETCRPICKVDWKSVRNGEPYMIFSGGMPDEKTSHTPSLTVMHAKSTTVLEMEHNVVDFLTLCASPWNSDFQDPYGILVLLENDLVVVDLTSPGYPCFENPYPMDIHESPVTACLYLADCPPDLIPAFYSVGSKQKKTGFSDKDWPIRGGSWGQTTTSYSEIIVTGHADGSLKFWDASAVTLQVLYKLKTAKAFEKSKCRKPDADDDPFAIQHLFLCPESRLLCTVGLSHVILFRFKKQENSLEIAGLEISIVYEIYDNLDSPELEYPPIPGTKPSIGSVSQQSGSVGSYSSTTSDGKDSNTCSVKMKAGARKWPAGYQPDLCCILTWIDGEPPPPITSISVNSKYGLMAFGNECGLAIVDILQRTCLLNMGTPDLYGSMDPYSRVPRSPKSKTQTRGSGLVVDSLSQPFPNTDECKSPTADQSQCPDPSADFQSHNTSHRNRFVSGSGLERITESKVAAPPREAVCEVEVASEALEDASNNDSGSGCEQQRETKGRSHDDQNVRTRKISSRDTKAPMNSLTQSGQAEDDQSVRRRKVSARDSRPPSKSQLGRTYDDEDDLEWPANVDFCLMPDKKNSSSKELVNEEGTSEQNKESDKDEPRRRKTSFIKTTLSAFHLIKKDKGDDKEAPLSAEAELYAIDQSMPSDEEESSAGTTLHQTWDSVTFSARSATSTQEAPQQQPDQESLSRTFRSESDLPSSNHRSALTNNNSKLIVDAHEAQKHRDDDHSKIPPQSAPPIVQKKEGEGFMRKVSRKIRTSLKKNEEGLRLDGENEKLLIRRLGSKARFEMIDLTSDDLAEIPPTRKMTYLEHVCHDKTDGSFSRSRSSSMSSLDNVSKEAIQCLVFADSFSKKSDPTTYPSLWVGTSLGSVLVISLCLPAEGEARRTEPVIVSPSGTIFRMKKAILTLSFLDCNGYIIQSVADSWQDPPRENLRDPPKKGYTRQQSMTAMKPRMSPTTSTEQLPSDHQLAIMCSERHARVMSLPSQTCAYKAQLTDTSVIAVAEVITMRDSVCLACYVANGHILVHSLPSLRPLLDVDFLPLTDIRFAKTFCFSNNGHALYFCSPSEVQKLTLSADQCVNLGEMLGELFIPCETPEAPKPNFFKNLFSGGTVTIDREELFGESSGKGSKYVAHYTAGTAGMAGAQERLSSATSEIGRAKMAAIERGEKLGELDERTERMKAEAEDYSRNANAIMLKYKNKKWYQF